MNDIAIYGAGGFGREIACVINSINQISKKWNLIGFFDDGRPQGFTNKYGMVLGGIEALNSYTNTLGVVMAIASPDVVSQIVESIKNPNVFFPNIIAPNVTFFDSETLTLGQGNVITFGGRISCNVAIGDFNLINGCVSLGHDVSMGSYNVLQPEVRISGEVNIGNNNFFGVRSTILQRVSIGNFVRVGASSVIMRKTKDHMSYFGNPARIMKIY